MLQHLAPYLVATLVVALRLAYTWESSASPFFDAPTVDALRFVEQARAIAGGDVLGREVFWHPPLYPYVLGALRAAWPDSFFWAARVFQALLAGISALLLHHLASKATGGGAALTTSKDSAAPDAPAWVPLASCGLFALYGPLIYFGGELLAVTLEITLYLALLALAHGAVVKGGDLRFAATGLVAGLAALTRPTILLFTGALFAWLWWRHRDLPLRAVARSAWLPLALPLAAVVLAVTWRNYHVGDDLVLISSNGGINLYIGNNAAYDSTVAIRPDTGWEDLVAEPDAHGVHSPSGRSSYFARKALAYAATDPGGFAFLLVRKAWLLAAGPEIKRNQNMYYARRHSRLLSALLWDVGISFPFGLAGPLGLLGLAVTWHRRNPALSLLRLYTLSYGAGVILFFVTARYRLPLVPPLLIFATLFAAHLAACWRNGDVWRAAGWSGAAIWLTVVLNVPGADDPDQDPQLFHDLGEVALRKGHFELARDHSRRALNLDPHYLSARHNLALALLRLGDPRRAAEEARLVLSQRPRRPDSHAVLGQAYAAMGETDLAARHLRRALQIAPGHLEASYSLGRLLFSQGAFAAAASHLSEAAGQRPGDFWLQYECARAHQQAGDLVRARVHFEAALRGQRTSPERATALNALGTTWLQTGDALRARPLFEQALAADPANTEARANLRHLGRRGSAGP